jgi:hypothetical protein
MKTKILIFPLMFLLAYSVQIQSQSNTGKKIETVGNDVQKAEDAFKKGKSLLNNLFNKKKKNKANNQETEPNDSSPSIFSNGGETENHDVGKSPYYLEFTIGDEYFLLDAYNDPDWVTLHAEKDRENDYLSFLNINGMKYGSIDGRGGGALNFTMVPKDRQLKNETYAFTKGESSYDPMIFFYFTLKDKVYELSKPEKETMTHTSSGSLTLIRCENTEKGIVEGTFKMTTIIVTKNKKIINENAYAEGRFRMPISIGNRMRN